MRRRSRLVMTRGIFGQLQWPDNAAMCLVAVLTGPFAFALARRWYMCGLQEGALKA